MARRELWRKQERDRHGVATAASAALMGLECTIFMGEVDMRRQHLNVIRMEMLGARGGWRKIWPGHAEGSC